MDYKLAAITVKFFPASNYYGARFKVISQRGIKWFSMDHGRNFNENHDAAVRGYLNWIKEEDKKKYGDDLGWGDIDNYVGGVDYTGDFIYVRKPMQ
jgi:hypothetical protein